MAKDGDWLENPKCPKCKAELKEGKHGDDSFLVGKYIGDGGELGEHIRKHVYKEEPFYKHPFFHTYDLSSNNQETVNKEKTRVLEKEINNRCGIEAHHLLTTNSVKREKIYQRIVYILGYNINHHKNGVLLPRRMVVACSYKVPLHRGSHDFALCVDNDTGLEHVVFPFDKEKELIELVYADRVNTIVDNMMKTVKLKEICNFKSRQIETTEFINRMDGESQEVYLNLINFNWTLSSDGFDYRQGGVGCCDVNSLIEKREKLNNKLKLDLKPNDSVLRFQAELYNNKTVQAEMTSEEKKRKYCKHSPYNNPMKITDQLSYLQERELNFLKDFEYPTN